MKQTAEEFLKKLDDASGTTWTDSDIDICKAFIEFAKLHVEAALEAASEKANMFGETQHSNNAPDVYEDFVYVSNPNGADYGYRVNKESILNAYPLDNIK